MNFAAKKFYHSCGDWLTGRYRVLMLLGLTLVCHAVHVLLCPFPKRDALTYLHILHEWNACGSFAHVLSEFPKFGLLVFPFLPLKWAASAGIPLYPASIVWMIFLSMISVYAFYKIVWLLSGDVGKATWCGALLAVHPMLLYYAGNLLRDTPYLAFLLLHVLCVIYAVRQRRRYCFVLTGVTLALALFSRFEAWELLVLSPVFSVFYAHRNGFCKRDFAKFFLLALAGLIGTALLLLLAVDDWQLLYEKGEYVVSTFLPEWMRAR